MFCSRCGKKVLESMLFCPFCGAEIIIPEQDDTPEELTSDKRFSFDLPEEKDSGKSADAETMDWALPPEEKNEPEPAEPEPQPEKTIVLKRPLRIDDTPLHSDDETDEDEKPGPRLRRSTEEDEERPARRRAVNMFMEDEDEEEDDFDVYEHAYERYQRRDRRGEDRDDDDDDDYDDDDEGFFARHLRGIVALILLIALLGGLAFYAMTDAGQSQLARINVTLPFIKAEAYSKLGFDAYQAGNYAQAGAYYERALARKPDNFDFATSAAMAYYNDQNTDKAAEMLKKCVEIDPNAVTPYVYLLNLYPDAASRPSEITQLVQQGYQNTGDEQLKLE